MPRKQWPSDEVQKYRKRVRRLADRIESKYGNAQEAQRLRRLADPASKATIAQLNAAHVSGNAAYPARQMRLSQPSQQAPLEQVRAPRKKRPSDEVYNARRRLIRQAERIERDAQSAQGTAKEQALGFAKYLREHAKATGKLTDEKRKSLLERLSSIREATRAPIYESFKVRRRNLILMQQLNAAGMKDADSSIPEQKKDVFWAATKGLWTGADVPRNERYDKILAYFYNLSEGKSSTAQRFQEWLKEGKNIQDVRNVFGDLQLVYEFVTEELNDPAKYFSPDVPYDTYKQLIIFAR